MPERAHRVSPALKHGAYSEATLLPGEDPGDFKKMHQDLIAEFAPNGRLEEETVATIAKLMWRRQNLAMFEFGQLAHFLAEKIEQAALKEDKQRDDELMAEYKKIVEANTRANNLKGEQQIKAQLEVVEITRGTTFALLMKELGKL
jgi:hypothetical protein